MNRINTMFKIAVIAFFSIACLCSMSNAADAAVVLDSPVEGGVYGTNVALAGYVQSASRQNISVAIYINNVFIRQFNTYANMRFNQTLTLGAGQKNLTLIAYENGIVSGTISRSFTVRSDIIPPTLTVTSPVNNATYGATINVTGTAEDASGISTVSVYVDDVLKGNATMNGSSFTYSLTGLVSGQRSIKVSAKDTADNVATATIIVTVDTLSPIVTLTSPVDNAIYDANVKVTGTAYGGGSSTMYIYVYVDNVLKISHLHIGGSFDYDLWSLPAGQRVIRVSVTNTVPRTTTITRTITVIPSAIYFESPSTSTITSAGCLFSGTATDPSGITGVTVSVYDNKRGINTVLNQAVPYDTVTKKWSFQVLPQHISFGDSAMLTARATKGSGGVIERNLIVNVIKDPSDLTPPTLTISEPQENDYILTSGFYVKGTASDNAGVGSVTISIYDQRAMTWPVNNAACVYNRDTQQWTYSAGNIFVYPDGDASINIRATDVNGNYTSVYRTIHYATMTQQKIYFYHDINYASPVGGAPTLADIDNDGQKEIIVSVLWGVSPVLTWPPEFVTKIFVWKTDGTNVQGWPQQTAARFTCTNSTGVVAPPAVADIDGDGYPEIIAASLDKNVYVWGANGQLKPGWPKATGGEIIAAPSIGKLASGAGSQIVVSCMNGLVYAWNADGTPLTGWPKSTGGPIESSSVISDIDQDSNSEIIACSTDGKVYVWNASGVSKPGWPVTTGGSIKSSPAVADMDMDPANGLELVVRSYNKLYILHKDGTSLTSVWPKNIEPPTAASDRCSPIVCDLDPNTWGLEIVMSQYNTYVYAWHIDGSLVAGWPVQDTVSQPWNYTPAAVDIDGDGLLEILAADGMDLVALNSDGSKVSWWPAEFDHENWDAPVAADINNDGKIEVVQLAWYRYIYVNVIKCPFGTEDKDGWPTIQHDAQRTGCYKVIEPIINNPPSLDFWPTNPQGDEGQRLYFYVMLSDPDYDALILNVEGLPEGADLERLNDSLYLFEWTPTFAQAGVYTVKFIVSDGTDSASEDITITVNEKGNVTNIAASANPSPEYDEATGSYVFQGGWPVALYFVASDKDTNIASFTVTGLPYTFRQTNKDDPYINKKSWWKIYSGTFPKIGGPYVVTVTAQAGTPKESKVTFKVMVK